MPQTVRPSIVTLMLLVLLGALLYRLPESLLFQPPQPPGYKVSDPNVISIGHLKAIWLPATNAKATIIYSHGRRTDIGYHRPELAYYVNHGINVLSYDYSGYGHSGGDATLHNIKKDSLAAYDYLVKTRHIDPSTIVAYGQTLGATMALFQGNHRRVAAVVLCVPYVNSNHMIFGWDVLPWNLFSDLDAISTIEVPVFFVHSRAPRLSNEWHYHALLKATNNPTSQILSKQLTPKKLDDEIITIIMQHTNHKGKKLASGHKKKIKSRHYIR